MHNLRGPLADRREILRRVYNASPKIWRLPPKNFGDEKHINFGPISDPIPLWVRISLERIEISKIGKLFDRQRFLRRWAKKVWWTLVH